MILATLVIQKKFRTIPSSMKWEFCKHKASTPGFHPSVGGASSPSQCSIWSVKEGNCFGVTGLFCCGLGMEVHTLQQGEKVGSRFASFLSDPKLALCSAVAFFGTGRKAKNVRWDLKLAVQTMVILLMVTFAVKTMLILWSKKWWRWQNTNRSSLSWSCSH